MSTILQFFVVKVKWISKKSKYTIIYLGMHELLFRRMARTGMGDILRRERQETRHRRL